MGGGLPKAETAAKRLMEINPSINCRGYNVKIPMPGHYINQNDIEEF